MPQDSHHTLPELPSQLHTLIQQDWEQEIVCQLPPDYEQQAHQMGAFVRKRGVRRASDVLRGLLAYVLCVSSVRELGAWSVLIGLANLSHVAWHKRIRKARDFLLWLLMSRLAVPVPACWAREKTRIVLIDATRLNIPGGRGDEYRAHLGYELLVGRLLDVKVSDCHRAEGFTLFALHADDLVVADRGYCRRKQLAYARQMGAQVLVRLAVWQVPLLDDTGAAFDVVAWLRACESGQHPCQVSFEDNGQCYPGRLIAQSLPPEQAERARAKERKKASKQQRRLQEQTLYLCGWLLLWSSLPQESWPEEDLLALYRARWQIELVIKRMKGVLKLAHLRGKTVATNEAIVLGVLLAWALVQEQVQAAREDVQAACTAWATSRGKHQPASVSLPTVSSWSVTTIGVQSLRQVVRGYWNLRRLRCCLPLLYRFLCSRRCTREHQESCIRRRLVASGSPGTTASSLFGWSSA